MRQYANFNLIPSPREYLSPGAKFKRIVHYRRSPRLNKTNKEQTEIAYKAASLSDAHIIEVEAIVKHGHIVWRATPSGHWFTTTIELSTWEARKFIKDHMSIYLVLLRGSDKKHYDRLIQKNRSLASLTAKISTVKLEPDQDNEPIFSGEFWEDQGTLPKVNEHN